MGRAIRNTLAVTMAALTSLGAALARNADDAAAPGDPLAALTSAIETAEALAPARWAFNMTVKDLDDPETPPLTVRFDPRAEKGEQWTPVSYDPDEIDNKLAKKLLKSKENDDMLVYDSLRAELPSAALASDDGETAVFTLYPAGEDMPDKMRDAVDFTAHVDKSGGHVSLLKIVSTEPFKPVPVAKIHEFEQIMDYAPVGPDGEVLLVRTQTLMKGKAAVFKKLSQHLDIAYSDFERIADAPAREPRDGDDRVDED